MYEIIQYPLDLGSYERLNTGIIVGNDQLFIYFQAADEDWSEEYSGNG